MKKFFVTACAAAMLVGASFSALADEASGSVAAVDPGTGTVTLADGQIFMLPAGFDIASLSVGDQVIITYEKGQGGQMQATDVAPAG